MGVLVVPEEAALIYRMLIESDDCNLLDLLLLQFDKKSTRVYVANYIVQYACAAGRLDIATRAMHYAKGLTEAKKYDLEQLDAEKRRFTDRVAVVQ